MRSMLLLLALMGFACTSHQPSRPVAVPPEVGGPVLSTVVGRDRTLVVRAGERGPTFQGFDAVGQPQTAALPLGELAQRNPKLAEEVGAMHASLWAGLD